jgi:predicted O-methyltransferase YrrM
MPPVTSIRAVRLPSWLSPASLNLPKEFSMQRMRLPAVVPLVLGLLAGTLLAQPQPPPKGGRGGPRGGAASFEASTLPKNDAEKRVLAVLDDMARTQLRGSLSVPVQDGRILRVLAESLGAKRVVEIGTSFGFSGCWFGLALQQTGGRLTTFEIDPSRAARARENFKRAGLDGLVTIIEGDAHQTVAQLEGPIDLLFLDADKEGYLDYLQKLLPKMRPGGLVVAHNITERQADPRYVDAITKNPELETVFINLSASGMSVSLKKR